MRHYYVYITASRTRVLYVGVTHNLNHRMVQHKDKLNAGFTNRYNVTRLVYYETFTQVLDAIAREKELKGWRREKKIALIESKNPGWKDLIDEWYREIKGMRGIGA